MVRTLFLLIGGAVLFFALAAPDNHPPPINGAPIEHCRQTQSPLRGCATPAGDSQRSVTGPTRTAQQRMEVHVEPPETTIGARASLPQHREMLARAVQLGILPDTNIVLQSGDQWEEMFRLWSDADNQIRQEASSRRMLGHRIALARLERGAYESFEVDESARDASGDFRGPWDKKTHPDEIVSNRYMHREGGGQVIHTVRIPPGEVPEIDEATFRVQLLNELRRDVISRFIQEHSVR